MDTPVVEEGYSIEMVWEAKVLAAFVIAYTIGSCLAAAYTHILYRYSGQVAASISLLALATSIQSFVSMTQAIIALCIWPTLIDDEYKFAISQWRNPNASLGHQPSRRTPHPEVSAILAVRVIGVFLFNVESMIFFFWTWILMCSTSNIMFPGLLSGRYHHVTKWLALILPVLQTVIINFPVVMATTIPQIILYNMFLVIPVFTGSICLIIILYKFSRARWNASWSHSAWSKKLRVWQLWDRGQQANFNASHSDPSQVFSQTSIPASGAQAIAQNRRKEEDRYLLLRFCVCFIIVSLFQLSFIFSQVVNSRAAYARMQPDAEKPIYGWTKSQQLTDWAFFIAGSSIGYFISLLFGTTQECRRVHRQQVQRFRTWREKRRARRQEEAWLQVEVMNFGQPAVFAVPAQRFGAQRSITMEALKRPEKVRGGYAGEEMGETWSPLYHPGGYDRRGRAPRRSMTVRSQNIITITGGDVV